jgi:two-component system, probable response regulator PhcQ
MYRILLVDDEVNVLSALRRVLSGAGSGSSDRLKIELEAYDKPEVALARAQEIPFDLVISDYRMPSMTGVDFLEQLLDIQPTIARLILSGYADLQGLMDAINRVQIFRFVPKPWNDFELIASVRQALAYRETLRENKRLADLVRVQQGKLSRHEMELRRLEEQYPGITHVKRAEDGSILLDDDGS